jgi:hypothetical protein
MKIPKLSSNNSEVAPEALQAGGNERGMRPAERWAVALSAAGLAVTIVVAAWQIGYNHSIYDTLRARVSVSENGASARGTVIRGRSDPISSSHSSASGGANLSASGPFAQVSSAASRRRFARMRRADGPMPGRHNLRGEPDPAIPQNDGNVDYNSSITGTDDDAVQAAPPDATSVVSTPVLGRSAVDSGSAAAPSRSIPWHDKPDTANAVIAPIQGRSWPDVKVPGREESPVGERTVTQIL